MLVNQRNARLERNIRFVPSDCYDILEMRHGSTRTCMNMPVIVMVPGTLFCTCMAYIYMNTLSSLDHIAVSRVSLRREFFSVDQNQLSVCVVRVRICETVAPTLHLICSGTVHWHLWDSTYAYESYIQNASLESPLVGWSDGRREFGVATRFCVIPSSTWLKKQVY